MACDYEGTEKHSYLGSGNSGGEIDSSFLSERRETKRPRGYIFPGRVKIAISVCVSVW
jgi:hypothetical protein